MASASANSANDVRGKVALLRAVVLAMADATTILANLVFVVTKCSIQRCKLTELVALMVVLPFWSRRRLDKLGD